MKATPQFLEYLEGEIHAREWTYADLARTAGLNPSTFSRIVRGESRDISGKTMEALCRVFGLTEAEIYQISSAEPDRNPGGFLRGLRGKAQSLALWLESQPHEVQDPIMRLAQSYGWNP